LHILTKESMNHHSEEYIHHLIELWLNEDIGEGDHTTLSNISQHAKGKAILQVKHAGIVAGIRIAHRIFKKFDPNLNLDVFIQDGMPIKKGDVVFEINGSVRSILQTERTVVNVMRQLSGVATQTYLYSRKLSGLKTIVLDTRKTNY
jgi:nicotinate-nucleotide pyrophosphorylase (carboxylating)